MPRSLSISAVIPLALLALVSLASPADSADPPPAGESALPELRSAAGSGRPPSIEVLRSDADGIELEFRLSDLERTETLVDGQALQSFAGGVEVPVFGRLIALPDGAALAVRSRILEEEAVPGVALAPAPDRTPTGASAGLMFSDDPAAVVRAAAPARKRSRATAASPGCCWSGCPGWRTTGTEPTSASIRSFR